MRYPKVVLDAIYDAYVPKKDGKPDPNVLYVGPFLDGLATYLPELLQAAFPRSNRPEDGRRHMKSLFVDMQATGNNDRASNITMRDFRLFMERDAWKREGLPPTLNLTNATRDNEPGEILNSYYFSVNPSTGQPELLARGKEFEEPKPWVPEIREDKRFGRHMLLRGDRFRATWTDRRDREIEMQWALRPLSEGSSFLTPEVAVGMAQDWA